MNLTPNNLELNIFLQKNKMLNSGQFVKEITQNRKSYAYLFYFGKPFNDKTVILKLKFSHLTF
ncbi:hypothetical protein S4054249_18140 [Pseudoalteromonas luteoviolacea]|uniref:Uncharacterized protein n=1 Tax=Pseudoalteromonas luteoviolacea S4054 TaxID=1129367 RepID=A0A0F6ACE1_9GAMM|nr:hypothetical protein S4054249_18140 [Pseudoalteromonas luteoviolacea]AOT14535.1 hypothetical protein S40542_18110 [Pseudoalteromonas luteoviolacea]AOT19450.1 hypothetical protein S4054_18115 [Pseudoalteromonas luteoviolacea]KKE83882.1 hypothetical protein N479_10755 [Pseudoalteromonas luteoviolacea S4054]KZN77276.1 hypothetical protein N481_04295 [Pseudoalteromonas luteoviolacea S4047-1]